MDVETGEYRITQVDILHDAELVKSALDKGQMGGFVQGMGWLTTEELLWDDQGRIISNSPANYKILRRLMSPKSSLSLSTTEANTVDTIYRSKAVVSLSPYVGHFCLVRAQGRSASFTNYQKAHQ